MVFNNSNIKFSRTKKGQTKIIYWHLIIAINYLRVIRRYISFGKSISNFIAILCYSPTTVITFHLCAGTVNAVRVQGSCTRDIPIFRNDFRMKTKVRLIDCNWWLNQTPVWYIKHSKWIYYTRTKYLHVKHFISQFFLWNNMIDQSTLSYERLVYYMPWCDMTYWCDIKWYTRGRRTWGRTQTKF